MKKIPQWAFFGSVEHTTHPALREDCAIYADNSPDHPFRDACVYAPAVGSKTKKPENTEQRNRDGDGFI
jgi:hypothetical protein